jgi:DNA repair ATPase RecN
MSETNLEVVVRNIDHRLEKVEQFLPRLATKEELQAAVAPLATKDELRTSIAAAIAPLATREELQAAVAPLATKEELRTSIAAAIAPLATKELVEESRRHAQVMFESLQHSIRLVADGIAHLTDKVDRMNATVWPKLDDHEVRLIALESGRAPRRRPGPGR